ncbi:MAG: PfkB family carbohydrate kinase [Methanobrevibacter sp.]|nr:PfkB family carbohydrate kinase [Methanobrevibacter sp.]
MTKLLIIGPITKDVNIYNGITESAVGGAVYYESFVFENLNIDHVILTTLNMEDWNLLNDFPNKDNVLAVIKDETLVFENEYLDDSQRIQKSNFANIPITLSNFKAVNIDIDDFDAVLINPLVLTDLDMDLIRYLKESNLPVFLSLQGLLREKSEGGRVRQVKPAVLDEILAYVDVLFLDVYEARFLYSDLSIEDAARRLALMGPDEVVITQNKEGSLIYRNGEDKIYDIDPFPVKEKISPTGAGDTYMAAYVIKHMEDGDVAECGDFASKVAALKLENEGPFNKTLADVLNLK